MSTEKLSEMSKPEQFDAAVEIHGGEPFAVWAPVVNGSHVKAELYFALLAELEAKDKRIAELEAKTAMTMGVGSGNGNLFVHGDYDSIKAAQAIVLENESLRAKLATPVRLPDIEFVKISGIDFPVMRADIVKKEIRHAGFKVEGDA
ncbi:hypothetical protein PTR36_00980 [Serratia bockelmannii]|uniref:hypothetical protein n=1 Tax=Serratia bockelmannii TaxID=2703793 RepID=UPI00313EB39A